MDSDAACKHLSVERRSLASNLPCSNMNICSVNESDEAPKLNLYQLQFETGLVGGMPGTLCSPKCWKEKQWALCPGYGRAS